MARTRWPPISRNPASSPGQADRGGTAGGCHKYLGPGRQVDRKTTSGVSRLAGQAGTQATTLRPDQARTWEAGPKPPIPRLPAEYARAYRCAGRASRLAPISQLWAPTLTGAAWGSLVRGCCSSLQFHAPEQRLWLVSLSQRPGKGNSPLGAWRLGCAGPQPGGSRTATKEGCA